MVETNVIHEFKFFFDTKPSFFIRVPGRVNLIGEHTDYNGFPVMPISIPHAIFTAVSPRTDKTVHIRNMNSDYPQTKFELSSEIPLSPDGHWSNYVKASAQSLAANIGDSLQGMNALWDGTIPGSAGLSSSSALVISAALSLLAANGESMDKLELAEIMAEGERYVGTQGGGMDQAICLLGKKGHAVKIDFFPLNLSYIPFPEDYSIVVAHSLVRAAKTENALMLYNRRPAECRLAAAIINARYKLAPPIVRLGDLTGFNLFETIITNPADFLKDTFTHESYTLQDVADAVCESPESITEKYLLTRDGKPMPVPDDGFLVRQRALHIFTEAARVEKSCDALKKNDLHTFGRLMNESHESCDKNYGISTPELNELVSIMQNHGASGARLTGAGFGGCAVALVSDERMQNIIDGIRGDYYSDYIMKTHPELTETFNTGEVMFSVKPSAGASVREL